MQQRPRTQWFCLLLVSFLIGGCTWFKQVLPGGNQLPNHDVRLSETVTPLSYDLLLRLNPSQRKYSGSVKIEVALSKQHGAIDLHAKHLSISDARFILNQETQTLRIDRLDDSFVRLSSQSVLPLGRGVIDLTFSGQLSQTPDGLYTVQDGGQFYIFSQFEPIAARTAFPCFDEPRFKTPFKIAVEIPDEQLAVSNAPEEKRVKIESGGTRFVFKPTRPIPTYLVAFGIGPLDVVETDVKLDGTVPFRIVVPKGKGDKTAFAIRETPSIYESLKQYLGASYPYQKLDFLAVPNFKAGAMENPGLVTYREPLLLVDETKVTPGRLRSIRGVIAHELAHMWFGNSVTLAWWNDIWLNEAFATWMADHVEIALNDQARALRSIARSKHRVMRADARQNVRAVRQEIKSDGDIENAFDGITYRKGASLLWMVERWVGSENLRRAIQSYLTSFEHRVAKTTDLLSVLDRETQKDVTGVMTRFLDHPGIPELNFRIECTANTPPVLHVSQTSSRKDDDGLPWRVPVCVRLGQPNSTLKSCFELQDQKGTISLPNAVCPTWFYGNDGQSGYYAWSSDETWMITLLDNLEHLNSVERATLPSLFRRRAEKGALSLSTYAQAMLRLLNLDEAALQTEALSNLVSIGRIFAETPSQRKRYHQWLASVLSPLWRKLDTRQFESGDVEGIRLRDRVRRLLGFEVRQQVFLERGQQRLRAMLDQPTTEWTSDGREWFLIGALTADEQTWQRIDGLRRIERNSTNRGVLVRALSLSPTLENRALARKRFTNGEIPAQDFWLVSSGLGWRDLEERWNWMVNSFPALEKTLTEGGFAALPWLGAGFCSREKVNEMSTVFKPLLAAHSAMTRSLALASESVVECERLRTLWRTDLDRFFGQ